MSSHIELTPRFNGGDGGASLYICEDDEEGNVVRKVGTFLERRKVIELIANLADSIGQGTSKTQNPVLLAAKTDILTRELLEANRRLDAIQKDANIVLEQRLAAQAESERLLKLLDEACGAIEDTAAMPAGEYVKSLRLRAGLPHG